MRKQLGVITSLLFLCATAFLGTANCSSYNGYGSGYENSGDEQSYVPAYDRSYAPGVEYQVGPVYGPTGRPVSNAQAYGQPRRPSCEAPRSACPQPACPPQCKPVCPQPCKPVCTPPQPACCEEPLCKIPTPCRHSNQNKLCCLDGITVSARSPKMCMLGEQYPLEFDIQACDDVCNVVVTAHLPEGASFVRSVPEAKVDGRKLVWEIGSMEKGQCIPAKVWVKCECEGELCACFCATATPVRFCSLLCAKPILTCHKCGPEEVCPGDPVNYTITVTNRGSCAAEDVVVTDNVPDGLEHSSCLRTLCFKLGTLEPCQTKKINLCFTAVKRGKVCNTAVVTACNADTVSCQWCTNVCKECIEISKVGPKEVPIGKNADYQITVVNPGDKPLTEVVVTDCAPSSTSIVAANGATIRGNQAVWRVKEIKPGEKINFPITLTTCTPGCWTNRVSVTNCQNCTACAEFTTRWRGRPALNMCITDTEDPICIGESTTYCITVTNQGSEADSNVAVVVRFPNEITPTGVAGDTQGTISGQTVTFAPLANFAPRQTLKLRIDARAKESGDARVIAEVSSDSIKTPIVQQESTIVN